MKKYIPILDALNYLVWKEEAISKANGVPIPSKVPEEKWWSLYTSGYTPSKAMDYIMSKYRYNPTRKVPIVVSYIRVRTVLKMHYIEMFKIKFGARNVVIESEPIGSRRRVTVVLELPESNAGKLNQYSSINSYKVLDINV